MLCLCRDCIKIRIYFCYLQTNQGSLFFMKVRHKKNDLVVLVILLFVESGFPKFKILRYFVKFEHINNFVYVVD